MFLHSNFLGIPPEENTLEKSRVVILPGPLRADRLVRGGHAKRARRHPRGVPLRRALRRRARRGGLPDRHPHASVLASGRHGARRRRRRAREDGREPARAGTVPADPGRRALDRSRPDPRSPRADTRSCRSSTSTPTGICATVRGPEELSRLRRAPLGRAGDPVGPRRHPVDLQGGGRLRPENRHPDRLEPRDASLDAWMEKALARLTEEVYVTFDVDFFDGSLVPGTGTPGAGGRHVRPGPRDPPPGRVRAADHRGRRRRARASAGQPGARFPGRQALLQAARVCPFPEKGPTSVLSPVA